MDATSRPTPTLTSASADGGRSKKRRPLVERRRTSPALAAYVAATIIAGIAALAWATLTLPLGPDIATDGLTHLAADDRVSGLLFWIAFGLLGSVRTKGYGGHAVLTFHLPFIVAAMALADPWPPAGSPRSRRSSFGSSGRCRGSARSATTRS